MPHEGAAPAHAIAARRVPGSQRLRALPSTQPSTGLPAPAAERLSPGRQALTLLAALGLVLALARFPLSAGYFSGAGLFRYYFAFAAAVALSSFAIYQAPARYTGRLQLGALLLTFGLARTFVAGAAAPVLIAATFALALALRLLPLERKWVRLAAIGALTASFALLRLWPPLVLPLMGMLQQALLSASHFRDPAQRTFDRCLRASLLPQWQPTPIPLEDLGREDLSPRNFTSGAVLLFVGPALYQGCSLYIEKVGLPDPVGELIRGQLLLVVPHAIFYAAFALLFVFSILVTDAATGRLLGLPIRLPMHAPWDATDFMDYWRRANTWVYHLMSTVYFRNFFPPRGWRFSLGVFVVFLITAWFKSATHQGAFDAGSYLRWAVEGALVGGTALWLQHRARSRVARFVRTGVGLRPRSFSAAAASVLGIFLLHGVLVEFSWHFNNDPVTTVRRALAAKPAPGR